VKIRQPYEETRYVPWLDREIEPGAVVDVPEVDLASYLEAGWEPADKACELAARKLRKAGTVTVGGEPEPEPEPERDEPAADEAEPVKEN
jgi:hypothetical protein